MITITNGNGEAMANAIARAFNPFQNLGLEQVVFVTAEDNCEDYDGGSWAFVTNDEGSLGFWYPTDELTYHVKCQNYYSHPAMPADAFGAACTLIAFNQMVWMLHQRGVDSDIVDAASTQYHALRNWIFDLSEQGLIDGSAVAGFID